MTMLPQEVQARLSDHLRRVRERAYARFECGFRPRGAAGRACSQVPECGPGMAVAVRVPGGAHLPRSEVGPHRAGSISTNPRFSGPSLMRPGGWN